MPKQAKQYTVRDVPPQVDRALRRRARETGRSLNRVAVEALAAGAGESARTYDDLDFMIGTMSKAEAARLDREVAAQRRIDPGLWR
jgi:hypothetical protein